MKSPPMTSRHGRSSTRCVRYQSSSAQRSRSRGRSAASAAERRDKRTKRDHFPDERRKTRGRCGKRPSLFTLLHRATRRTSSFVFVRWGRASLCATPIRNAAIVRGAACVIWEHGVLRSASFLLCVGAPAPTRAPLCVGATAPTPLARVRSVFSPPSWCCGFAIRKGDGSVLHKSLPLVRPSGPIGWLPRAWKSRKRRS